jgi:alkylated DNA repair dioxygenase AlkB
MARRKVGSGRSAAPPEGLIYRAEILAPEEERDLLARCRDLPLKEFEFQGYLAKRRVIYYGWQYRYGDRALHPAEEIPDFLQSLRNRVAPLAERPAEDFPHAMVTEYRPGTPIGWHRDKAVFGDVIGVSLLSSCVFRLRRRTAAGGWERYAFVAEPRSAYLLHGPARTEWEHSIPEVDQLRYSITFRTLREPAVRPANPQLDGAAD